MNVGLPGPFPVSDSVAWGGAQEYAFLTGPQVLLHRVSQRPERPSLREPEATLPSKGLERAGRGASFIPTSHGGARLARECIWVPDGYPLLPSSYTLLVENVGGPVGFVCVGAEMTGASESES